VVQDGISRREGLPAHPGHAPRRRCAAPATEPALLEPPPPTGSVQPTSPHPARHARTDCDYFAGKKRITDFQVQLRFLKPPPGIIHVGWEGSAGTPKWGLGTRVLTKVVRKLASVKVPDFAAVWGEGVHPKVRGRPRGCLRIWQLCPAHLVHRCRTMQFPASPEGRRKGHRLATQMAGGDPVRNDLGQLERAFGAGFRGGANAMRRSPRSVIFPTHNAKACVIGLLSVVSGRGGPNSGSGEQGHL
jgi:hypothetical protein